MQSIITWRVPVLLLIFGAMPAAESVFKIYQIYAERMWGQASVLLSAVQIEMPVPILLHVISALAVCLMGPWQLTPAFRARFPAAHRVTGRIFVAMGVLAAGSAIWMNEVYPNYAGIVKYYAVHVFGAIMIFALLRGVWAAMHRDIPRHRAWMIRAYAIGLGASTQRLLIIPLFMIFGEMSEIAIGIAMTTGWAINLGVAEWIIARDQPRRAPHPVLS